MLLVSEKVAFRVSTTDVEVVYTESSGVRIRVDVQTIDDFKNDTYREVEFHFLNVAEVRCITLNFFDFHYGNVKILDEVSNDVDLWERSGISPDSRFYQVADSETLKSKKLAYDPNNRLDLKHYLVVGCDSHIEIIASKYEVLMFSGNECLHTYKE